MYKNLWKLIHRQFWNQRDKRMSDDKLEKIKVRKAEMLFKLQSISKEILNINSEIEFNKLINDFPDKMIIIDF